jgi:uncharacterized membrane protein YgcG
MGGERPAKRATKQPARREPEPVPSTVHTTTAIPAGTTIIIQQQQSQSGPVPDSRILLIALLLAAVPLYIAVLSWVNGVNEAAIALLVLGGGCALVSIVLSFYAMWGYWSLPGYQAAKVLAIMTLTFGMLSFGLFVVLPLIALLFCRPPTPPSNSCNVTCPDCACNCDCDPCCGPCPNCCDPCGGCCGGSEGSSGGCCECGDCCGGSSSSSSSGGCCGGGGGCDCGGDCCGGSSSGGGSSPDVGVVATGGAMFSAAAARFLRFEGVRESLRAGHFAHHPDRPEFKEDVVRVHGIRLCVGCLVVFPAFLLLLPFEALILRAIGWQASLAGGLGLALMQGVSALGWTKRRWMKVLVKSALGSGLALFVIGVRAAPWSVYLQAAAIGAVLVLALASTLPRRRRMANAAACAHKAA